MRGHNLDTLPAREGFAKECPEALDVPSLPRGQICFSSWLGVLTRLSLCGLLRNMGGEAHLPGFT